MADLLATPADLASLLQHDVDTATATLALQAATAVVQAITGQRLVQVVGDVQVLDLDDYDGGPYLLLPERPVTAVSAVSVGDTVVTDYSTQLSRSRLWRTYGWRSALTVYPAQPSTVTVTYSHGYAPTDQRLQLARAVTLSLAGVAYTNPSGAVREQIDDYAVAYDAASTRMGATPMLAAALRRQYGRTPGSARLVTS